MKMWMQHFNKMVDGSIFDISGCVTSVSSCGSIASGFGTISHCVVLIILYNYTLTL